MRGVQARFGINPKTGKKVEGIDHIKHCILDILTTRVGTRIMRRTYGSYVPTLIDSAMNPAGKLRVQSAIASAVMRWEPRVSIVSVVLNVKHSGQVSIQLNVEYKNKRSTLDFSLNNSL